MKYLFFILFSLTFRQVLAEEPKRSADPSFFYSSDIDIVSPSNNLQEKQIQFSVVLLDPSLNELYQSGIDYREFDSQMLPLDVHNYWEKKGDDEYYVALTKVAYTIDQPVGLFSRQRLSNLHYLEKTIGDYKIQQLDKQKFKISSTLFSPSFTYELDFFNWPEVNKKNKSALKYTVKADQHLGTPSLSAVQHNYDYGRVMLHKTTEMSVSITNYYSIDNQTTLVVVYSLNYLHNIPPELLGGKDILINEIKKMIRDFVIRTRKANNPSGLELYSFN